MKLTPREPPGTLITDEILDLYARARDLAERGRNRAGDEKRVAERCSAKPYAGRPDLELHHKLGRQVWEWNVMAVDLDTPDVDDAKAHANWGDWAGAVAAREALEAALAARI